MIFKNILIALDGSARAERAIPWVKAISPFAQVTLVTAIEPGPLFESGSQFVLADRYLTALAETFVPQAKIISRTGSPTLTLLDIADEIKADLIAVTARTGEKTLGRVTEKVIHGSTAPVLVVPSEGEREARIGRMLVPLDGSRISEMILPLASEISKQLGTEIILSHVVENPLEEEWRAMEIQFPGEAPRFKGFEDAVRRRRTAIENYLTERSQDTGAKFVIQEGHPAEALLALADYENVDMIVIAAHGHGFISRLILGSVATKIIRVAKIPVLVAKHDVLRSIRKDASFLESSRRPSP
jgi:nucleotide-binding universal stress UspA family protein